MFAVSLFCIGAVPQAQAPTAGLASTRIILLVDSGSGVQQHYQRIRSGLTDFLAAMPEDVEIGIVSCGGQMRVRLAPTTDRAKQRQVAESFSPDGGANTFLDALVEADQRFLKNAADKRPVFVVIATDGSTNSEPRIDAYNRFLNEFRQRRGMAHAVVLRSNQMGLASQVLENLAQNTGGTVQVLALSNGIPDALKQIAERVVAGR
jgi:Mg-chelatase subunit ChlD